MKKSKKIVIIGSGPTGIGAAYHLHKLGYENWVMYEKNDYAGGHSSTHVDSKGFLWDEGVHVLFSHYKYFDKFVKEVLGKDYLEHERESWIELLGSSVPYPFQNNLHHLSPDDQFNCVLGHIETEEHKQKNSNNFEEWILHTFGKGIADLFMVPYNKKVWATPLKRMSKDWIAERVSTPDNKRVLKGVIHKENDVTWGPNNKFKFPKYGGTGEMYRRGAKLFGDKVVYGKQIIKVDVKKKEIKFKDGTTDTFDYLISAMPINELVNMILQAPKTLKTEAKKLLYNSVFIVGLGIEKRINTTKCWVYYPEKSVPFYRLTYFHNYSPYNVPKRNTKKYSSLMLEIAYSKFRKINKKKIVNNCIDSLIRYGVLDKKDRKKIISKATYDLKYGYPIPTIDRDKILVKLHKYFHKHNIFSRGRYGAWKYEISNMDHCFMQGVESVDKILKNKKEQTWTH